MVNRRKVLPRTLGIGWFRMVYRILVCDGGVRMPARFPVSNMTIPRRVLLALNMEPHLSVDIPPRPVSAAAGIKPIVQWSDPIVQRATPIGVCRPLFS
jgi:hypothetical protein